jgi:elongation factor G
VNELESIRNIGISAHIDSGKTTLTERILFYAGKIHKMEEVRGGGDGATMDHMELEKEKGITITSAATTVSWGDHKINIIDTPGHVDFTVEVERSLRVLDGAILILCSVAGVQSQSITVDRQMKRYSVPRLAFINKMDRVGADPIRGLRDLQEKLNLNAVLMQVPIGAESEFAGVVDLIRMEALYNEGGQGEDLVTRAIPDDVLPFAEQKRHDMLESLSLFSEELMETFLDGKEIDEELIHQAVLEGVRSTELVPVFLGTAIKNTGVQPLMDAICRYLPSPIESATVFAKVVGNEEEEVKLFPDPEKPFVCMAFKLTDEDYGQLTYIRIYQGTIQKGDSLVNSRTGRKVRVGRLVRMHANDRQNIDSACAGDIIAMIGVDCASGDTFCHEGVDVTLESMYVPNAVISYSIQPKETAMADKLVKAITRFMKEDPTFHVHTDEDSGEMIISGMGELHLEIYIQRIQREYDVGLLVGPPQVNYREAVGRRVEFNYTHRKQTGGAGQFANVVGDLEPLDFGANGEPFEFENHVKGGNIPQEYISSCEAGFRDVMTKGPLAEFPIVGLKVNLRDGKHHAVDSSDLAFRTCARTALHEAIRAAAPCILEPIMKVEVETPVDFQGGVIGDLSSRRGMIAGMDTRDDMTVILASVPLAEMFGYATALRSSTAGKATYSMEFEKYAVSPKVHQDEVIAARAAAKIK